MTGLQRGYQMSIAVPHTLATMDNAAPAMSGVLDMVADALTRQSPNGGSGSRAWPVHIKRLLVLDEKMKATSRLRSVALACRPWTISVTTRSAKSPHVAKMLNVDHVMSWGRKSEGLTTDIEGGGKQGLQLRLPV